MTNPTPRPALRKAEDATVHPAAPRPARTPRTPRAARPATTEPAAAPVPAPRTIADTNRDADAAARARAGAAAGKQAKPAKAAKAKPSGKRRKFSGSTSDHLRVPDTEFLEHPKPKGKGEKGKADKGAASTSSTPTSATPKGATPKSPAANAAATSAAAEADRPAAVPAAPSVDLMKGKVVDLGARVPKKLRTAAREEARRRGLDLDAVTTELLHDWLTRRD